MTPTEPGRSPRILLVTTVAGTLRAFLLPFASRFRSQGWVVDGLAAGATAEPACVEAFDHVFDVPWTRRPRNLRANLAGMRRLRAIVAAQGYDIVHLHTPVAAFFGRRGLARGRSSGRPRIVYTAHGFHFHEGRSPLANAAYRAAERLAARWTDRLVVVNDDDFEAAHRHGLVPAGGVSVVRGIGVDVARFDPGAVDADRVAAVRAGMGVADGDHLVLMSAEFRPGKGHGTAIEALGRLGRGDVHLAFAGVGRGADRVRESANAAGLGERVHLLGFRGDMPDVFAAADLTLLPSTREGASRSVLESMSMETPVVGSRVRGIRDLIVDGETGVLCPVGDAGAFARAIARLLDDPEGRRAMGRRAREAVAPFTIDRVLDAYEQIYRSLL